MKKNYIELLKQEGEFRDMELWLANCHHDGHTTEGFALVSGDTADFFETDPRELAEHDLDGGWRLPAYISTITDRTSELIDEVGKLPARMIEDLDRMIKELKARGYTAYLDSSTDYLVVDRDRDEN